MDLNSLDSCYDTHKNSLKNHLAFNQSFVYVALLICLVTTFEFRNYQSLNSHYTTYTKVHQSYYPLNQSLFRTERFFFVHLLDKKIPISNQLLLFSIYQSPPKLLSSNQTVTSQQCKKLLVICIYLLLFYILVKMFEIAKAHQIYILNVNYILVPAYSYVILYVIFFFTIIHFLYSVK